jgi:sugar/nucleoside kinase (ribokinase family)
MDNIDMNYNLDLVSLGEILIDFTPAGRSPAGDALFQRNLGGSAVNLACAFANLGGRCAFIGKAGDDSFGHFCADVLRARGVDMSGFMLDKSRGTTLAFVHLSDSGDRSFSFYRRGSADISLEAGEVDERIIFSARAFHFGGVSLTDEPARTATLHAARLAKSAGLIVSFDPNLRLNLWQSPQEAKEVLLEAFPLADIVKLSEEEAEFLFGCSYGTREGGDVREGGDAREVGDVREGGGALGEIARRFGTPLAIMTLAARGAVALVGGAIECASPAYGVDVVDTTGAGDCFLSGALHYVLKLGKAPGSLSRGEAARMLAFANAAGSLVCTKMGAIAAQPTLEEIESLFGR